MSPEEKAQRWTRYIRGDCVDCGEKPYSPGRPRCTECNTAYINSVYSAGVAPTSTEGK